MEEELTKIAIIQELSVKLWHEGEDLIEENEFLALVLSNHRFNYELWHEEDKARDKNAPDTVIAKVKRNIDFLNQKRNDCIEKIDEFLLSKIKMNMSSEQNSETMGGMIDRLSILSLKIFHMLEQVKRTDIDNSHKESCQKKADVLLLQRNDLKKCLLSLYRQTIEGKRHFVVYHQYKMYNDPTLNPVLYQNSKHL